MRKIRSVTDKLGRRLEIPVQPERIVSLCPSQTETLFALGLKGRIVGRTRYCIHPADAVREVAVVGGTKKVDISLVRALEPDLIIAEKEENTPQDVQALSDIAPVYVTVIESYEDALESILELGDITATSEVARQLVVEIERTFARVPVAPSPLRVLYLIWRNPYMAAGNSTYIHSLLKKVGWTNVAATLEGRYPVLEDSTLPLQPQVVLLSTEPYPFQEKHFPEAQQRWPNALLYLVRGDYFSWYGVRMKEAALYLQELVPLLHSLVESHS
ncbi:MAG: helical backbone metal receptor [Bacteroidia bacterium]|nr:helical backbone metal receptor [Bacteroidia bacterium]MDW8016036.1 helical backbone metal receptor [Bacteroidia bacterium]